MIKATKLKKPTEVMKDEPPAPADTAQRPDWYKGVDWPVEFPAPSVVPPKFDRVAYQRNYMRLYRARQKAAKGETK